MALTSFVGVGALLCDGCRDPQALLVEAPQDRDTVAGGCDGARISAVKVHCDGSEKRFSRFFEKRLSKFFDRRQDDTTGFLPSFDLHDDLPEDFKDFLRNNPGFLYDNALAALEHVPLVVEG